MEEETFKAAVWYKGKTVNQDGNNPRYVGGIVKFIDVDPNTKVEVFLCTVRDIFGIPEASLKSMLQPGLMLHPFYVEENVVKDVTDTISNMPICPRSARNSNVVQSPPTRVEFPVKPSASAHVDGSLNHAENSSQAPVDRDDPVSIGITGDRVGMTSSTDSSQMRIFIESLCGLRKTLDVERTETVGRIKERIRKTEGTAAKDQKLVYEGKNLAYDRTLADYGI
ncbi:hypothetical protein MKW92_039433 [Papaver armeniacum]|nr:hypothetical protein MKW92_039433 [Papaver armeniacum]